MATLPAHEPSEPVEPDLGRVMAILGAPGEASEGLLQRICNLGLELLGVDRVAVWVWADTAHLVCQEAAHRQDVPDCTGHRLAYDRLRDYYNTLGADRVVAVADFASDPRVTAFRELHGSARGPDAILEGVVLADGDVVGTLCCESFRGRRDWGERERHLVSLLTGFAALGLETDRRRAAEAGWHASQRRYVQLLNNLVEGVFQLDPQGRLTLANPALAAMLGYADPESLLLAYNAQPRSFFRNRRDWHRLMRQLRHHGQVKEWQLDLRQADRSARQLKTAISARAIFDEAGRFSHIDGTISDITERKRIEERLRQIAYYDSVTGLLNRNGVLETLREQDWAARYALVLVDIDNFQTVNDSLGLEVGDFILYRLSQRVSQLDRHVKAVGRSQADVFLLLLADVDQPAAEGIVARLQESLRKPVHFGQGSVTLTATAGLALQTERPTSGEPGQRPGPEEMFRRAGVALKRAKSERRAGLITFTEALDQALRQRLATINAVSESLEHGGFEALFQPQLCLRSKTVVAVEALARWRQNDGSLLAPAHFIEAAEESGQIARIGDAVLHCGLAARQAWVERSGAAAPRLAVNVSARELHDTGFPDRIRAALAAFDCPPAGLELEITETAVMEDMVRAQTALASLRALGVSLAIDDFGTGYSSLAYLNDLPVDKLKIDRSFITALDEHTRGRSIMGTIVALGQEIGLDIVAEGVETPSQLEALTAMGANIVQGFYFATPLAPAELLAHLPPRD